MIIYDIGGVEGVSRPIFRANILAMVVFWVMPCSMTFILFFFSVFLVWGSIFIFLDKVLEYPQKEVKLALNFFVFGSIPIMALILGSKVCWLF